MKSPRISIGLDPHTLKMLEEAERVLENQNHTHAWSEQVEPRSHWRIWLCKWAIMVVAREIAATGKLPIPLGVDLRHETPEETEERCGEKYAKTAAYIAKVTNAPRFKWTPENLN